MADLRELDDVAYVRFASVYRNFREAKDLRDSRARGIVRRGGRGHRAHAAPAGTRTDDQRFMTLALALGRRGLGRTWPNPAVGAVS